MNNVSIRRKTILLLVLVALVTTPWASAASPKPASPRWMQAVEDVPLLGNFWSFLRSAWDKEGCNIDPNGRCIKETTQDPKIGCNIDPNGHCIQEPTPNPQIGCGIDPWGHCIP
jgi:hypothetical protein